MQRHSHRNRHGTRLASLTILILLTLSLALRPEGVALGKGSAEETADEDVLLAGVLYACEQGLCLRNLKTNSVDVLVSFDTDKESLFGYAISRDGQFLAYGLGPRLGASAEIFIDRAGDDVPPRSLRGMYGVEDAQGNYTGFGVVGLSADGRRVVYETNGAVYGENLTGQESYQIIEPRPFGWVNIYDYDLSPSGTRMLNHGYSFSPYVELFDVPGAEAVASAGDGEKVIDLTTLDPRYLPITFGATDDEVIALRFEQAPNPNPQSRGENMELPVAGYERLNLRTGQLRPIPLERGWDIVSVAGSTAVISRISYTATSYTTEHRLLDLHTGQQQPLELTDYTFGEVQLSLPATAEQILPELATNIDGTIAYVWRGDIWLANLRGGFARQLTDDGFVLPHLAWSTDGHWLYYASKREGSGDIYRVNEFGVTNQRLTATEAPERLPVLSPEGSLYFVRDIVDDPRTQGFEEGSQLIRFEEPDDEQLVVEEFCYLGELTFLSNTSVLAHLGCLDFTIQHVLDLQTGQEIAGGMPPLLEPAYQQGYCKQPEEGPLSVSRVILAPDKQTVAFVGPIDCTDPGIGSRQGLAILTALISSSSQAKVLLELGREDYPPSLAWSSNGKYLVIERRGGGGLTTGPLRVVDVGSGAQVDLPVAGQTPIWRPGESAAATLTLRNDTAAQLRRLAGVAQSTSEIVSSFTSLEDKARAELWASAIVDSISTLSTIPKVAQSIDLIDMDTLQAIPNFDRFDVLKRWRLENRPEADALKYMILDSQDSVLQASATNVVSRRLVPLLGQDFLVRAVDQGVQGGVGMGGSKLLALGLVRSQLVSDVQTERPFANIWYPRVVGLTDAYIAKLDLGLRDAEAALERMPAERRASYLADLEQRRSANEILMRQQQTLFRFIDDINTARTTGTDNWVGPFLTEPDFYPHVLVSWEHLLPSLVGVL